MFDQTRIGIDLGGTKVEAAVLDREGQVLFRKRRATPTQDYVATIEAISSLVEEAEQAVGSGGTVGVGIPGAISPATGCVKNANSTWLNGRPLERDLAQRLGRLVKIANDANCFAVSEAVDGAGRGASPVFGVILGTGVGGGIVLDGRPLAGFDSIAGEWGHNPLPATSEVELHGDTCWCGRVGCLETWLSGPALARDHALATGRTLKPLDLAAAAEAGNGEAAATLARYERRLARALAVVINILDPEVIVLGGGLSNIARLYDNLPGLIRPCVFSDRLATRILPPRHGDSSGVRGAAWLWP